MSFDFTTTVHATAQVVGFHHWPNAPAEVAYLAERHRHLFNFRIELTVDDHDREVEFHLLKRWFFNHLSQGAFPHVGHAFGEAFEVDFGSRSCETIADAVLRRLIIDYPLGQFYRVTVDEDGENGATVAAVHRGDGDAD